MSESAESRMTELLCLAREGSETALGEVYHLIENELRRLAGQFLAGEKPGHTLQPTILVDDAFVKLVGNERIEWQDRAHFMATAARSMRRLLIDHARRKSAGKRGSGAGHVMLDEELVGAEGSPVELLALDELLASLEAEHCRQAKVVELKVFGGLSNEEIAEVVGVSPRTVKYDWRFGKAWLLDKLLPES